MLKKIRVEREHKNGWSRWVQPIKKNYILSCCDCGLCHHMEFRIIAGHVQFKAKRAPRYTQYERKKLLPKGDKHG